MDLNNYVVQIRRGIKRITLQRFLCSKIAYGESFSNIELAALFNNQLWLQKKCSTEADFQKKFGKDLESLAKILKETRIDLRSVSRAIKSLSRKLEVLEDFNLPERNLSQLQLRLHNWVWLETSSPDGTERSRIPPKRYIGIGYTDKGSARKAWEDGSPSWQEMALIPDDRMEEFHRQYTERQKKQQKG